MMAAAWAWVLSAPYFAMAALSLSWAAATATVDCL